MQFLYLIFVCLFAFTYCQDPDLVDRWEHSRYPNPPTRFNFYSNNTFEGSFGLDSGYECFRIKGTYTANTKKTPRWIDITFDHPNYAGRVITAQGLYEVKAPTSSSGGKKTLNLSFGCDFCYIEWNNTRPTSMSCSSSLANVSAPVAGNDPNLVGNWIHSDSWNTSRVTFGSDGSFSYYYDCSGGIGYSGSYSIVDMSKSPAWIDLTFAVPSDSKYTEEELYSITTKNGRKELTLTTLGFCTPYPPSCKGCRPTQFWSHETVVFIPGPATTTGGKTSTGTTGRVTTGTTGGGGGNCGPTMSCQQCTEACAMTCKYTGCALDLCNSDCKRYNCGMFCGGTKRLVTYEVWE